ncbi:MAG: helix-turn-helix transcriptional regulator [Verrucomicrobia bacterium]|nr:helix-turn-helix transcriptional regulator [Verrucomicrobiota bacterium]
MNGICDTVRNVKAWTAKRIQELREAAGLSQAQLADFLGVTGKHVSHLETGFRPAGPQSERLLTVLEKVHKGELKAARSQRKRGKP